MGNGLTDHELLMEVRDDVDWIRNHMGGYVTRKEFYGTITAVITLVLGIVALG